MLYVHIIAEDTELMAHRDQSTPGMWDVVCLDDLSKKKEEAVWSDDQLGAVVALILHNEGDSLLDVKGLYEIAEPLFTSWAKEVRPIP